jgi:integrase
MPNQSVRLTQKWAETAPAPASGQAFIRDGAVNGFGLRITSTGVRSFIFERRIEGKVRRITLGRLGELNVEQARRKAQALTGKIAMGENPIAEKERERICATTLADAFKAFKKARSELKERTLYDYERLMKVPFAEWQDRPLVSITKDLVAKRHRDLGEKSGHAYANLAMRFLRSLFNFAIADYEDGFGEPLLTSNPVHRLTQTRVWFREKRRQTVIKVHEMPAWRCAVCDLRADDDPFARTISDYLLVMLFTGLRRSEAARLTWDRVDFEDATLRIVDTKNHEPHLLPLGPFVVELLEARKADAQGAFVFPGEGPAGYLIEPKRYIAKVIETSKVAFTLHDLRRTFITVAESIDVAPYSLKRLVNHRVRSDVTQGYIVSDLERLREPMGKIETYLLSATGIKPAAKVVPLPVDQPAAKRSLSGG